jgi:hypothetical protein
VQKVAQTTDRLADYLDNDPVPDSVCRAALGGVTDVTFYNWEKDSRWEFPRRICVRGHKYRRAGDVRAFRKQHFGI